MRSTAKAAERILDMLNLLVRIFQVRHPLSCLVGGNKNACTARAAQTQRGNIHCMYRAYQFIFKGRIFPGGGRAFFDRSNWQKNRNTTIPPDTAVFSKMGDFNTPSVIYFLKRITAVEI